jgi:hypothetical protein
MGNTGNAMKNGGTDVSSGRSKKGSHEEIFRIIKRYLNFLIGLHKKDAPLRDKVGALVRLRRLINEYGASLLPQRAARDRILAYLQQHVGQAVDSEELAAISGIQEFARRIRELRVQFGYEIVSGLGREDLRPDQYMLLDPNPNPEAAERWRLANGIRRRKGMSAQKRILEYLKANLGKVVNGDELYYVANIKEWARRVRELRTEQGWRISTQKLGRPDLKPGQYVLETLEKAPSHERTIPEEVAEAVYERDGYRCVRCGWSREAWTREDPRYLVLHHRKPHGRGGPNTVDNLEVRCNRCHEQAHTQ